MTEEKLQQMSDKVEATDKDREKNIKKDMQEMKQRYDTVNSKLGNLETRMDSMSRDQVQTRCHLEKLDNTRQSGNKSSTRQQGRFRGTTTQQTGVNTTTTNPGCSKHSTGGAKTIMKSGIAITASGPGDSTTNNNKGSDAMTWASTWEMMNRTLEAFATRNTDSSERGGGKSRKTFKKPKEFKDDSGGCIDTWVEVIRLHLEQDNLNDERQTCTAILSNLEGTALKCVVAKKEEECDTADKIFEILLN